MLLSVNIDPSVPWLVVLCAGMLVIGLLLKVLKQPYIIGYILAGVLLGPSGLGFITDQGLITTLGDLGLILLLFFIGMEISLVQLITNWRISFVGTLFQVILSLAVVSIVGGYFDWPINRIIMLGFVVSLSSTAVVIKLLQDRNESESPSGRNAIGILLAQDVLIVPMLILLTYLSGAAPDGRVILKQLIGAGLIVLLIWLILKGKATRLPFEKYLRYDHELQVFTAFVLCFGFATVSAFLELSPALGAFVAGFLVTAARATHWFHTSLHSFRVVFVALFFVSIGMLIDLAFVRDHIALVVGFATAVLIINTAINTVVMRFFKRPWRESIYTGAILAQIGEFSFILGSAGYLAGMITEFGYNLVISIISITLLLSPFWILLVRSIVHPKPNLHE